MASLESPQQDFVPDHQKTNKELQQDICADCRHQERCRSIEYWCPAYSLAFDILNGILDALQSYGILKGGRQ